MPRVRGRHVGAELEPRDVNGPTAVAPPVLAVGSGSSAQDPEEDRAQALALVVAPVLAQLVGAVESCIASEWIAVPITTREEIELVL